MQKLYTICIKLKMMLYNFFTDFNFKGKLIIKVLAIVLGITILVQIILVCLGYHIAMSKLIGNSIIFFILIFLLGRKK